MQETRSDPENDWIARLRAGDLDPRALLPTGEEPARFAIRKLMPRLLRALLEAGADPNRMDPADQPLLHEAIQMWETGRHGWAAEAVPQMIDALVAAGANLDARGSSDYTALHEAALRADGRICEQLIRAGADLTAVAEPYDDEAGRTPYEVAASCRRTELAALLQTGIPADELDRRRQQKAAARRAYLAQLRANRGDAEPSA